MTGKSSPNKAEIRGYIKSSVRLGKDSKEIFKEVCDVYGNKCMSLRQVYRSVSKLKNGQTYLNDKQRPGAPVCHRCYKNNTIRYIFLFLLMVTFKILSNRNT